MNLLFQANLANIFILALLYANLVTAGTQTKPNLVNIVIPENRALKKAWGFNEDTYFNFTELVTKYGYTSEQHDVTTEDGYILSVFRILPKCGEVQVIKFHPVLLAHGIMDSSDVWIIAGTKTGLGYVLSDNCYDVWAVNNRGNRYSRKHIRLNPDTDAEYWKFSFDEFGNYDLPALVDYILNASKRPRLYYVGHSQGTTNFFVMNSLRPQYNDKIRLAIQLAPVAWLAHINSPLPLIVAQGTRPIMAFLEAAGIHEILARNQILHTVLEFLCQIIPDEICGTILAITSGYEIGTISPRTLAKAFGHLIAGISSRTLGHFGQLIVSKRFQRYDEGKSGNLMRYGSSKPPDYNVSIITCPIVLINAKHDYISTLEDIDILNSQLPHVVENYIVPEEYWSHHNHVFGTKATTSIYPMILNYFSEYDNTTHLKN